MTIEWLTFWLVVVTAVLVGVTFYYAITTHGILTAMRQQAAVMQEQSRVLQGQAQAMREQSQLLAMGGQSTAWAGIIQARSHTEGINPRKKLEDLAQRLDELERQLAEAPHRDVRVSWGEPDQG